MDDFVPLLVFNRFAKDFIQAFIKLMFDLGFETKEELDGRKNLKLRKRFAQITTYKRDPLLLSSPSSLN